MRAGMAAALAFALSASAPVAAALPPPDKQSLDYYLHEHVQFPPAHGNPLDRWEDALVAALAKAPPERAADAIAADFGLPKAQMEELVRLWLFVHAAMMRPDRTPAQELEVRQRFLALLAASQRSPLVLHAAAATLIGDFGCSDAGILDRLMEASRDKVGDAWLIANAGGCAPVYARFAETAPDRAFAALFEASGENWLRPGDRLPLLDYLASPAAWERVDAGHRDAVATYFTRLYLANLLAGGLIDRAIRLYDSLPPDRKGSMLVDSPARIAFTADGLPFQSDSHVGSVRTAMAAAFALGGRTADASALLAGSPDLAAARRMLDCQFETPADKRTKSCESSRDDGAEILLLDHFLNRPADDPYPIAEVFYGGGSLGRSDQGAYAELGCRVFADPGYLSLCESGRDATRDRIVDAAGSDEDEAAARALIAAARIPDYARRRDGFAAELAAIAARGKDDAANRRSFRGQPPVDPDPPPFAALPIPESLRGQAPATPWSKSFARLPEGYEPVRVARDGERVAVISVSQNYDPTGEVSSGGYWVHLSGDGGRSWKRPLYTGLADRFPYVVVPDPRLPLFDGDVLNLAVEIKELDTRSIMYPPVALATRRSEGNLYLRIPIADLERDSDGDGLTDLAARHLLLDGARAPGATPFVVGRSAAGSCGPEGAVARAAMQAILEKIFSVRTGALIQPVDRDPAHGIEAMLAGLGKIDANSADRPILVEGDPADYACLAPDRLMIVYSAADLERLRRMTPDFHAVKLNKVIFNRARDRGYIVWSSGWTGGTFRLRRIGGEWKLETISSWIT